MQIHGTAMGPHNACSYADLSMGEFDDKALNGYKISPQIWWRFRDDIFSFWEHGEEALMEFLEFADMPPWTRNRQVAQDEPDSE